MILLLLLLTISLATVRIIQYQRVAPASGGWIEIHLHDKHSVVSRILWCKSITPNNNKGGREPAPLNDCKGAGLLHMVLYTRNHGRSMARIASEEGIIYINPEDIGGFDTDHPYEIVVETDTIIQVVQFNYHEEKVAATVMDVNYDHGTLSVSSSSSNTEKMETTKPVVQEEEIIVTSVPSGEPSDPPLQWKTALITILVGLSLMGAAVMYIRLKRMRRRIEPAKEYELVDMKIAHDDNLQILMSLGPDGANPAFRENLK